MPTPDELQVIFEKLVAKTATDEDIEILRQAYESDERISLQVGKSVANIGKAEGIQIGDRIYQGVDAQVIREIVRSFIQELQFSVSTVSTSEKSVDDLVEQVRSRFHDYIQRLHGTMPLLAIDN